MMGKGTIVSHLGEGQYNLTLNFNRERGEALIAKLQVRISEISAQIPDLEDANDEAEENFIGALEAMNEAIMDADVEQIDAKQESYLEAMGAYQETSFNLSSAELEKASLEKKVSTLQLYLTPDAAYNAWCADLSEDLSGEVGTIEIPGERDHVLIRPGHGGAAEYDGTRDGQITPIFSSTPAATFYNMAMLPGWQKWMPNYRLGTITSIDADAGTANVDLDSESSSAQLLEVNQTESLSDVSVEYMTCDAAAFEVGDRVVIEFEGQDWKAPKIIGFEKEPRPCAEFSFTLMRDDGVLVTEELLHFIYVYNSDENFILNISYEYNNGKWYVTIPEESKDPNGYWVSYFCVYGAATTQYPYRWRASDQFDAVDLITSGDYSDNIPYFKQTRTITPSISHTPMPDYSWSCEYLPDVEVPAHYEGGAWGREAWTWYASQIVYSVEWESSLQVTVREQYFGTTYGFISQCYGGETEYEDIDGNPKHACCAVSLTPHIVGSALDVSGGEAETTEFLLPAGSGTNNLIISLPDDSTCTHIVGGYVEGEWEQQEFPCSHLFFRSDDGRFDSFCNLQVYIDAS